MNIIDRMADCPTCNEYAARRLPTVIRAWWKETGQRIDLDRFLSGVHQRHLAGLPVLAEASR